jgi:hypothetical protein
VEEYIFPAVKLQLDTQLAKPDPSVPRKEFSRMLSEAVKSKKVNLFIPHSPPAHGSDISLTFVNVAFAGRMNPLDRAVL